MVVMVAMATEQRQTRVQADNKDERRQEWAQKEKWNTGEKTES